MDRPMGQPLGLEPELGGQLRQSAPRSGYEPELGELIANTVSM